MATSGAPFWKYNVIDVERQLEVEVGFPVAIPVAGDDRVLAGVLPAGKYGGSRLEIYWTDPAEEPNMNNWETELALRLAD